MTRYFRRRKTPLAAGALVLAFAAPAAAAMTAPAHAASATHATAATATRIGPATAVPPPAPHVVNLHSAFARALPHVRLGRIAGIIPPRGKRMTRAKALASGCTEPNCPLPYHGGPVQHTPHVYLLLWGPNWPVSSPAYADLYYLYSGLGVTSHDTWSRITSQYGDASGNPAFGSSVFAGAFQDSTTPPASVTPGDLAAEADGFTSSEGIADLADAQVVIASQAGTCFSDGFAGSCGTPDPNGQYCAWHSYSNEPFTNLPYQLDAGTMCGENFINPGSAGTYDGFSTSGGHEYAETITDPLVNLSYGWIDLADPSGGEVGDKCDWGGGM